MTEQLACVVALAVLAAIVSAQSTVSPRETENAAGPKLPAIVEGQPIESRPPEKKDNKPWFPEQTRAPYHATAPYKITTLIDGIPAPWSLAFLPDGNILITERLPGKMRLLHRDGRLSPPLAGVSAVKTPAAMDLGLLDVVVDPKFAENHRLFFTFYDFLDRTNSNTRVARAQLDEDGLALTDVKVIFRAQPDMPSKRL